MKSTPMRHPKPNALSWLVVSVIVIALDQWTKAWVLSSLPEYTPVPVIDGFWNWYRTYRSEEHTSELQSLMRISYAVFCLKKKKPINTTSSYPSLISTFFNFIYLYSTI